MIDHIIDGILRREGGYSNNPNDAGGETNHGITLKVARRYGYTGPMRELPRETAREIYRSMYWEEPKFNLVAQVSPKVAEELCDTGVNMGTATAIKFLQRSLNALNKRGEYFSDILVDGKMGASTLGAFQQYMNRRGQDGERVMLKALNGLQTERYISLAESREQNEDFVYGWIANRV